jgi:hypothetical protein
MLKTTLKMRLKRFCFLITRVLTQIRQYSLFADLRKHSLVKQKGGETKYGFKDCQTIAALYAVLLRDFRSINSHYCQPKNRTHYDCSPSKLNS